MSLENSCHFKGNLTTDPLLKYTPSNIAVLNFTIAVNRTYTKKDGTKGRETFFAPLEAWDKGAEYIAKNFSKGDRIDVECSAKTDQWKDKETESPRSRTKFRVNEFDKLPRFVKRETEGETENAAVSADKNVEPVVDVPF